MTGAGALLRLISVLNLYVFVRCEGSLLAYALYPDNMAYLFVISPFACAGVACFLLQIKPEHIDHDAARGLKTDAKL